MLCSAEAKSKKMCVVEAVNTGRSKARSSKDSKSEISLLPRGNRSDASNEDSRARGRPTTGEFVVHAKGYRSECARSLAWGTGGSQER